MIKFQLPYPELQFETARSSGAGGQHVNRTESAVLLRWNIRLSPSLDESLRMRLLGRLHHFINREGEIVLKAQEFRSQKQNKDACLEKLLKLIERALQDPKKRVKTKPTAGSRRRRLEAKKKNAEIKQFRKKVTE